MTKAELRKHTRRLLAARTLTPDKNERDSKQIQETLMNMRWWQEAEAVLLYLAMEEEVRTDRLVMEAMKEGKRLGAPTIVGRDLVFRTVPRDGTFVVSRYGIREPEDTQPEISPSTLDRMKVLLIVPGLAFDWDRNRLGRGAGYYDRTIRMLRRKLEGSLVASGVCYGDQLLEAVPTKPWDEAVDLVVTESTVVSGAEGSSY
jgi:5-formyltetrahydrofolate cyclo-ligase